MKRSSTSFRSTLHRAAVFVSVPAIIAAMVVTVPVFGAAPAEAAGANSTPGTPQTPQVPTVVYAENFQNTTDTGTPVPLDQYTGSTGMTYTADPSWLPSAWLCNGWVLNSADAVPALSDDGGCNWGGGATGMTSGANTSGTAWFFLQQMTGMLGQAEIAAANGTFNNGGTSADPNATASAKRDGLSAAADNNAISSQTNANTTAANAPRVPQAPGAQVETTGSPVTAIAGHYYAVSAWFAEAHCSADSTGGASQKANWLAGEAQEDLDLVINGGTANATTVKLTTGYNPCNGPKVIGTYNTPIRVSFIQSAATLLTNGGSLGLELYNENGLTTGNDVAFDLPEIVDVTPQMDKTFGTVDEPVTTAVPGQAVPMTVTITNTTELAAKDGWSFTDKMDSSLSIAPGTTPTTTCNDPAYTPGGPHDNPSDANPNGTVKTITNADGSTSLVVTGNLAQGQAYCTITAQVVSDVAGDFANGPSNITSVGLDLPDDADLVVPPPTLSLNKTITKVEYPAGTADGTATIASGGASASSLKAGDVVTYSYQVTNTSLVTLSQVHALEADPPGTATADLASYPYNGLLPNGKASPTGKATAEDLGASFNGSKTVPVVGNCTYDEATAAGAAKGSSITNGDIELGPSESATCTATYTVTQADVDNQANGTTSGVVNTAVAIGTNLATESDDPSQQSASDTSTATLTFDTNPAITLHKKASTASGTGVVTKVGDTVSYSFQVVNSGKVTLTGVGVKETDFSGTGTAPSPDVCTYDQATAAGALKGDSVANYAIVLAPGESATCTATYAATQADLNEGVISNAAEASGTPPATPTDPTPKPVTADDSATVTATPEPALTVDKTPAAQTVSKAGDVTWTVKATNSGDTTLNNVKVSDLGMTPSGATAPTGTVTLTACLLNGTTPANPADGSITLAANDYVTCTATYTVTPDDITAGKQLVNTASATGTPPATASNPNPPTVTDEATATLDVASISLVKNAATTATPVSVKAVDDPVTYTFDVTNTGSADLTDVAVSDPMLDAVGLTITCPSTTLAAGATQTCQASGPYKTAQADLDAGAIVNKATVTGTPPTPPDGPTPSSVTADSTATVPAGQYPSISITKQASVDTVSAVNDPVTYTFDVTNTGNVTLSPVTVSDPTLEAAGLTVTCPVDSLAPNVMTTCTASGPYKTAQADLDKGIIANTATATGTPPATDATPDPQPVTADSSVTVTAQATPSISVVKSADVDHVTAANDPVVFSFTVTNDGNVMLDNVALTDDMLTAAGVSVSCPDTSLAAGASMDCTASGPYKTAQADVDAGSISNTASVTGTPPVTPSDPNPKSVTDNSTVTVPVTSGPSISLVKSADVKSVANAGDPVKYSFDVTNTGNVTLSDVAVSDPMLDAAGLAITCPVDTLAPGVTTTCEASGAYDASQADIDAGGISNTATATGTPPVTPLDPNPKSVTAESSLTVPATPAPQISLVKSADVASVANAGDPVKYSFDVTNTGNVTLSDVAVSDPMLDAAGLSITCPVDTLAPGVTTTCVASGAYDALQADIDAGGISNTATATGTPPTPPGGTAPSPVTAESSLTVPATPAPSISLVKSADVDHVANAGDAVNYSFDVTNNGNVTLHNVAVSDPMLDAAGLSITCPDIAPDLTLAPGASTTCVASGAYDASQADIDAGGISNTATATGTPPVTPSDPTPASVTADSSVTVPAPPTPSLTLVKSVVPGEVLPSNNAVGTVVTYSFLVTNTGNVTLSDIGITDTAFSGSGAMPDISCPPDSVAPGKTTTCTATYTLTQPDVDAGTVVNTATAQGTPPTPAGQPAPAPVSSDPSTATVTIDPNPVVSLTKSVDPSTVSGADAVPGTTVTYTFDVVNDGNVTLTDIAIDEGSFSGTGTLGDIACGAPTLAPGASTTCTAADYALTQADVEAGTVTNTATAQGTPPTQVGKPAPAPVSSDPSNATVTITPVPSLTVVKTADPTSGAKAGTTVAYTIAVTNSGHVTVDNVQLAEVSISGSGELPVIDPASCTPAAGSSLAPGATMTCSASYVVTQADFDAQQPLVNVANATGTVKVTDANGAVTDQPVLSNNAQATTTLATPNPSIDLVKTDNHLTSLAPGDAIAYTFTATNTGDITLANVTVDETSFSGNPADLGPIEGCTGPDGSAVVNGQITLAPSDVAVCHATYQVQQADVDAGVVTNTADATGTLPTGIAKAGQDTITSGPSTVNTPGSVNPNLELAKTVSPSVIDKVGTQVTYSFLVTNTGNVTVKGVQIHEGAFSGTGTMSALTCPADTTLAPGATLTCTATYTITQADYDAAKVTNDATASGTDPSGAPVDSNKSTATVNDKGQGPSIFLVKTVDLSKVNKAGDKVVYSFLVTNTGDVTLTNIYVVDNTFSGTGKLGPVVCPAAAASLAPGASVTCTAGYTVTQPDMDAGTLTNSATAYGKPPTGPEVDSDPGTTVVTGVPAAELALSKTVSPENGNHAGSTVTYSFKVTNTGNVTITGMKVVEQQFSGTGVMSKITCPASSQSMAPGAVTTCTATYVLTTADQTVGSLTNRAIATGSYGPSGKLAASSSTVKSDQSTAKLTMVTPKIGTGGTVVGSGWGLLPVALLLAAAGWLLVWRRRRQE